MPALYTKPQSIDELITQTVSRVLDLYEIETDQLQRWGQDIHMHTNSDPEPS